MITIPLLGTVTANVGKAPFQYAPTNGSLGLPRFNNPTSNSGFLASCIGLFDCAAGFWGLSSLYCSVSQWRGVGTYNDLMVQQAGSVLASFGIFDNDQTLSNPAEYHAVLSTGNGYISNQAQCCPTSRYVWTQQASGADGPLIRYRVPFPNLIYANSKTNFSFNKPASFTYPFSVAGPGYMTPVVGFVAIDTLTLDEKDFGLTLTGITNISGGIPRPLAGMCVYPDEGIGFNTLSVNFGTYPYQGIVRNNPSINFAVTSPTPTTTGIYYGALINPVSGVCLFCVSNHSQPNPPYRHIDSSPTFGLCAMVVYYDPEPSLGSYYGTNPIQHVVLGNASDNALLTGNLGVPKYQGCVTPNGDFLLGITGGTFFLIKGDLSGYYRIRFLGQTSAAETAVNGLGSPVGFGMDINGNVWFGSASPVFLPILYSTFGLGWSIVLDEFPDVSGNALACAAINGTEQLILIGS